jgi:hypothetical protein
LHSASRSSSQKASKVSGHNRAFLYAKGAIAEQRQVS